MSSEQNTEEIVENIGQNILNEDDKQSGVPCTPGTDAVDITPSKDGGVLKEIKRTGAWGIEGAHPLKGDTVSVHYVGTLLDGTKFDSSQDRGEYFTFTLGKGQVIKAWDLGVATMKRGELAVLTCKAEYAYGETGSPPKIPPNATLVFEVELFDWKGEDVSADKDEGVLRSILHKGTGYTHPNDGATCNVHILGRHNGVEFDDRDVNFVLGEGCESGIVDGVEQALRKMTKGEKSRLMVKAAYAYGQDGTLQYNIPPDTDLEYEVTLKDFEKTKETWEMDSKEKIEQSELMKQKGTDFFKKSKYKLAQQYYKKILDYLDHEGSLEGDEAKKRETLLLAAHLNIAMCYLKMSEDLEAVHSCDKALEIDSNSVKGLFRRGTAQQNLQNHTEALEDFKAVLELDPNNKAAKNQITITNNKIQQFKQKERRTYAGMFDKFAQIDAKREADVRAKYNLTIDQWDNKMADGMLPIQEEVAAFGEVMPEPKYNKEDCKENLDPDDD